MKNVSSKKNSEVMRYYWQRSQKYPRRVAAVLLFTPVTVLINNYLPTLLVAGILTSLSTHDFVPGQVWESYGKQLVAYAVLLVAGIGAWRLLDFFVWRLEMDIQRDISEQVFRQLLQRSADFHANNFTGSLVSKTNKIINGYVRIADTTYYQTYPMLVGVLIAAVILWPRSPIFAVILVAFTAIYLMIALVVARPVQRVAAKHSALESNQTGLLADAITNVMAIKSFARGKYENQRFGKNTSEVRESLRKFALKHQMQMNTLGVMNRMISISALFIAIVAVLEFHANIATVFLIFSYTEMTVSGLFQFSNSSLRNYNRTIGDAHDMVAILAEQPEIQDPKHPEKVRIDRGAIRFADVDFAHDGAQDALFKKLNISIKPGEKIGLIGHSGSGKSTFTRLLLRFSDIQSGEILIDGQNIAHITQDDLHEKIAYVPQEPLLFHRSIRENIAYGSPEADDRAIEGAAKMASAHGFVADLPDGYETLVGERGVKLSGGQRQRVAIARAMLKNAPILVLDEATSALDSESEVLIQKALWKLMEGRTAIVIAHRLSTIQKMDRILVMDNGEIVEQGTHKELVGKPDGTYAKLWAHQSGGFIEE